MATTLLWRTPAGAESIPAATTKTLGTVNVANSAQIRIVCDERAGSVGVTLHLVVTEGNELVGPLDTITLSGGANVTRVYDVPGTSLTITAVTSAPGLAIPGLTAAVDVLVYGH